MQLLSATNPINTLVWISVLFYSTCYCKGGYNVLFLVVDDMRPQLGAYFSKTYPPYKTTKIHTPNMNNLASRSLLMERSYVQYSLCGPSRSSFLTGRRPDTTRTYGCSSYFRTTGGNFTTIPQYFKNNGYRSVGMGKIFHFQGNPGGNDPISWSEPYFHGVPNFEDRGKSWEAIPDNKLTDKPLLDKQTADHAVKTLQKVAPDAIAGKQPFFMAVGFRRPHLPFVFPESYLQYYPFVTLPDNLYAPVNMPSISWSDFKRLRFYSDTKQFHTTGKINATTFPREKIIDLRRAYHSCVTWVDAQIGRVLSELDRLNLSKNTIVSLIGDHGYSLGENGLWCKQTNFELATHAPMMISIPEVTNRVIRTKQLTEFVDLFPTLVEAAGLKPLPLCPEDSSGVEECTEGVSLLPLIKSPGKPVKNAAFSQFFREEFMGYSIRTDRYRYTEWIRFHKSNKPVTQNWANLKAVELYDHKIDPEENVNRVRDPMYKSVKNELSTRLHRGWRKAMVQTSSNFSEKVDHFNGTNNAISEFSSKSNSRKYDVNTPMIVVIFLITLVIIAAVKYSRNRPCKF